MAFNLHKKSHNWKDMESPVLARYMRKTSKADTTRNSAYLPTLDAKSPNQSQLTDMMSTNYIESEIDIKSVNDLNPGLRNYYWRDFSQRSKKKPSKLLDESQRDSSLYARLGFSNRSDNNSKIADLSKEDQIEQDAEMAWVSGIEEWIKIHSGGTL